MTMEIHIIKPTDKDYPVCMELVENKELYDLISIDGTVFVPLVQVIDALSNIKADVKIHHGKRVCPNCGAHMMESEVNTEESREFEDLDDI